MELLETVASFTGCALSLCCAPGTICRERQAGNEETNNRDRSGQRDVLRRRPNAAPAIGGDLTGWAGPRPHKNGTSGRRAFRAEDTAGAKALGWKQMWCGSQRWPAWRSLERGEPRAGRRKKEAKVVSALYVGQGRERGEKPLGV